MNLSFKKTSLMLLALAATAGLFWARSYIEARLNEAATRRVVPSLKDQWGLDVRLDGISLELLKGGFTIRDLRIANPAEFDGDLLSFRRVKIRAGLGSLFKSGISIKYIRLEDGIVNVVREDDGRINFSSLLPLLSRKIVSAEYSGASESVPWDLGVCAGDSHLANLAADFVLRYSDSRFANRSEPICSETELSLQNMEVGSRSVQLDKVQVSGVFVEGGTGSFTLSASAGSIPQVQTASFELSGTVDKLDIDALDSLMKEEGLGCSSISGEFRLLCEDGVFDRDNSNVNLVLHDVRFEEKLSRKLMGLDSLDSFSVEAPVDGSLTSGFEVNYSKAMERGFANKAVQRRIRENAERRRAAAASSAAGCAD